MSERAEAAAATFARANDEVIAVVEACGDDAWRAQTAAEGWPVGFAAWHIGASHEGVWGLINGVANGEPVPPLTAAMLDAKNAADVTAHAMVDRDEVLRLLREQGATVADGVRALADDQLDRRATIAVFSDDPMSVEELIGMVLAGHVNMHLASIQAVV